MALTNYVAVFPEVRHDDTLCTVHAPGCADIAKSLARFGGFEDPVELDFDADDFTANMKALDPDELGYEWANVATPRCATNHATKARRAAAREAAETPAKPRRARRAVATPAADPQPATGARRARKAAPVAEEVGFTKPAAPRRARRSKRVGEEVDGQGRELDYSKRAMHLADNHPTPLVEPSTTASTPDAPARLATCDDATYALALRVRELRVGGTAWWRIAHEMGLPGSGPDVKTGKTGAAGARRLWAQAWGKTYSDTSVPRDTKASKEERVRTAPPKPYFADDATDAEIAQAVSGREITWYTRLKTAESMVVSEQKADVAHGTVKVVQGREGRVIEFHEMPEKGSRVSGPRRSVYVNRIEKVAL